MCAQLGTRTGSAVAQEILWWFNGFYILPLRPITLPCHLSSLHQWWVFVFCTFLPTVPAAENSRCSVSPASAFAIATAAAGHSSPPGTQTSQATRPHKLCKNMVFSKCGRDLRGIFRETSVSGHLGAGPALGLLPRVITAVF